MVDAYRVVPSGYVPYNSKDSFTRKVSGEALDAGCTPAIRVVSRLSQGLEGTLGRDQGVAAKSQDDASG